MGMEDLAKPHMPDHSKHGMGRKHVDTWRPCRWMGA